LYVQQSAPAGYMKMAVTWWLSSSLLSWALGSEG